MTQMTTDTESREEEGEMSSQTVGAGTPLEAVVSVLVPPLSHCFDQVDTERLSKHQRELEILQDNFSPLACMYKEH